MEALEVKKQFKTRKIRQILVAVLVIPIIGILFYVRENPTIELFGLNYDQIGKFSLIIIGIVLVFSYYNWRCPSCKKYIGKKINPNHCDNCGVELR